MEVTWNGDDEEDTIRCEKCGVELYAFLDGCPYCDDEDNTAACPSCGASIYDDAEQCNRCGAWVSMGGAPAPGRSPLPSSAALKKLAIAVLCFVLAAWLISFLW